MRIDVENPNGISSVVQYLHVSTLNRRSVRLHSKGSLRALGSLVADIDEMRARFCDEN